MEDMVGLTLACLNIKKLVKMMVGKTYYLDCARIKCEYKKGKHRF